MIQSRRKLEALVFLPLFIMLALGIGATTLVDSAFGSTNPIIIENQYTGSDEWQLNRPGFVVSDDQTGQIKDYSSTTSVNKNNMITFYVTVNPSQQYAIDIYRMGWYNGQGGRLMRHVDVLEAEPQPNCPVDVTTGLIECEWAPSYSFKVPSTWTSGVYLALLTNSQNYQNYIIFVVRDNARVADLLYQQPVTTYQAYNLYPNDGKTGKNLYEGYGTNTIAGSTRAVKVSFDRPYTGTGAECFMETWCQWELSFIRWLERSGYDVSYSTDVDTHTHGVRLRNYKGVLSVGHDEYWSKAMYDAVEEARDDGVNVGFFGANAVYWQIRFEASQRGIPDRIIVCYKDASLDPINDPELKTVLWRDPPVNRAEQALVGIQFGSWSLSNSAYIVADSSNWVFANTGFNNGDTVAGINGYEVDRYMLEYPLPPHITYTLLSESPFTSFDGHSTYSNSSIYQAPSGAWVFAAGTISWSWGLDRAGYIDPRIQQTTANILNTFVTAQRPQTAPPSNLSAQVQARTVVHLSWIDNSNNESGYVLERSRDPAFTTATMFTLSANTTTFIDTDVMPGNIYYYRVKAATNEGGSQYSPTAKAAVLSVVWLPTMSAEQRPVARMAVFGE